MIKAHIISLFEMHFLGLVLMNAVILKRSFNGRLQLSPSGI